MNLQGQNHLSFYHDGTYAHFFNRQLDFSSEPGVANEILENEVKSCLAVA